MRVVPLIVAIVVLTVAAWLLIGQIRGMSADPDYKQTKSVPLAERRRLGKLIRSEQVIGDREESSRAEIVARSTLKMINRFSSGRYLFAFSLAVLAGLPLWVAGQQGWPIRELPAVLLFAAAYFWSRRRSAQIERTAEINGWRVEAT